MTVAAPPAQVDRDNPWPGLSSYDESSREFFSGRKLEADDLQRRILAEPVTVLFGKSGLGKTSLLKAGVFPGLREKGLFPILIRLQLRPGSPPLMEQVRARMFDELREQGVEHPKAADAETLWDYLHRNALEFWTAQNRLVRPLFVFDQFEELFTLGRAVVTDVQRFREDLADLVENRIPGALARRLGDLPPSEVGLDEHAVPCKVVIALREDFLADLEEWRLSMPSLRRNRMRLLPMGPDQALEAVYNERTRHLVSEPLAQKIVTFLASAGRAGNDSEKLAARAGDDSEKLAATVEPALLSLFCHGVNEHRKRDRKPAFDDELVEGAEGTIVLDFYRDSVGDLPRRVPKFIEEELVTEQGFRNSYPVDSAIARKAVTRPELDRLINLHLLRHEHHLGVDRVELTHDLLTKAVVYERDARRKAERRRNVMIMAGVCALVVLGSVLAVLDFSRRASAEQQARAVAQLRESEAQSRELAAHSERGLAAGDPKLAIRQARNGLLRAETAQARSALIKAAQYAWPEAHLDESVLGGMPKAISLSPDGNLLAILADGHGDTPEDGRTVTVWDLRSLKNVTPWPEGQVFKGAASLMFSPNQKLLAVGLEDSVELLNPETASPGRSLPAPNDDDRQIGFSPDSRWLAATVPDIGLALWDLESGSNDSEARKIEFEGSLGFALLNGNRVITVRDDDDTGLGVYAVERAANGRWTPPVRLDLSDCMRPVSASPGVVKYTATWQSRACTFDATENSGDLLDREDDHAPDDIVWSPGGRAFVELLSASQQVVAGGDEGRAASKISRTPESLRRLSYVNDKSRLVSVSEDGRRLALIEYVEDAEDTDEEQKRVSVFSLGDHKPFLSWYPSEEFALAADASWIAFVNRDVDGTSANLEVVRLDERLRSGQLSEPPIALKSIPNSVSAAQGAVIVVTGDQLRDRTTDLYDIDDGQRRFESLTGDAEPLGRDGQLLLLPGERSRVLRASDAAEVARWDDAIPRVSSGREAMAVFRRGSDPEKFRATLYVVRGEELVEVGEIPDVPDVPLDLTVAEDGRSLIDARDDEAKIWRVDGAPSGAPAPAERPYELRSDDKKQTFSIVRSSDKSVRGTLPYDAENTVFSGDNRWLAMWRDDRREVGVFDLEREEVVFDVAVDAPGTDRIERVAFVAGNRVIRVETFSDAMLIPLDRSLTYRFAFWLAPGNLDKEQICLYGLGGEECRTITTVRRAVPPPKQGAEASED